MSIPLRLRLRRGLRVFTLGSGPLKRRSDRLEFAWRVLLTLTLLLGIPLAVAAGNSVAAGLHATAHQQAQSRALERATLLRDAPAQPSADGLDVTTSATWLGPDGRSHTGNVAASPGARAGSSVDIWVDRSGRPVEAPMSAAAADDEALVAAAVTFLAVVIAGLSLHLVVHVLLTRQRNRRWEAGWQSVEPLWVSRFR